MRDEISPIKGEEMKHDSIGNRLVYIGNRMWIREKDLPTRKEVREEFMRYQHPKIYLSEVIVSVLFPIFVLIIFTYIDFRVNNIDFISRFFIYLFVFILLKIKNIAIFIIKIYQVFAPLDVRYRCCMTPSCSHYAILAIKKYGLIIGGVKTIIRLRKCRGQKEEDYP